MRFILAFLLALCGATADVHAQRGTSGGRTDLFYTQPYSSASRDTKGLALCASQTVNPAVRNHIVLVFGQSLGANVVPSAYTPPHASAICQLNIFDGALYEAKDPLLGTSYPLLASGLPVYGPGNFALRLAEGLVADGTSDHVVLVPVAVGASYAEDWESSGFLRDVIAVAMRHLTKRGIVAGTNVNFAAIWVQGQSNTIAGTSQAAHTASLTNIIAGARAAGFTGPIFITKMSYNAGVTSSAVTNAQDAVVDHGAGVWAGADSDALVGSSCSGNPCRQADDVHWSDAGSASFAAATKTKMGLYGAPWVP